MARIREVAAAKSALAGIHVIEPDLADLRQRLDQGYRFVAYSLDIRMLRTACRQGVAVLKDTQQ